MVKALECYLQENHDALNKEWQHRLELVSAEVSKVPGVTHEILRSGHRQPRSPYGDTVG